ncbi:MAG: hypothetical protein Q9165_004250 [Trypethelium subeluteriae]
MIRLPKLLEQHANRRHSEVVLASMSEEQLCNKLMAVPTFEECLELAKSSRWLLDGFYRHAARLMFFFLTQKLPDPELASSFMKMETEWVMRTLPEHWSFHHDHDWWLFKYQRVVATALDFDVLFHEFRTLLQAVPDIVPWEWRTITRRDFDIMSYGALNKMYDPNSTWSSLMHYSHHWSEDFKGVLARKVMVGYTMMQLFRLFKFSELLCAYRANEAYRIPMGEVGSPGMSI